MQLQGYALEPLASVRYDLVNTSGTFTNLEGYLTRQWFDTHLLTFTTNWFECLDIPLTNGANTITLYGTDQAGNLSSNVYTYTLDYSSVSSPPALTLYWPQDGARVSGTNFTLRGLLDDPTATVMAQITDASNVTSQAEGLVERNGLLWVEHLPLGPGTNTLSLTMSNAAGLSNTMSLTVVQGDVAITISDLSGADLNQPRITVMGTISSKDYTVWVNGIEAALIEANPNGTWSWQAESVPVNEGGTAVVQARAIPSTDSGGQGVGGSGGTNSTMADPGNPSSPNATDAEADPDKKPQVVVIHYDKERLDSIVMLSTNHAREVISENIVWDLGRSGCGSGERCYGQPEDEYYSWHEESWNNEGTGTQRSGQAHGSGVCGGATYTNSISYSVRTNWDGEFCCVTPTRTEVDSAGALWSRYRERTASTRYELRTNGKALSQRQNLFVLSGTARGVGDYFSPEIALQDLYAYDIDPSTIILGEFGLQGNDGRIYKALGDNTTHDITPWVLGNPYYTFQSPGATKHKLILWASTTLLEPNRVVNDAKFCVGQRLPFLSTWAQWPPYAGDPPGIRSNSYDWVMSPKYVNRQSESNSAGCVTYDVDPDALKQWHPSLWYVSGQSNKNVRLERTVFFDNGQSAKLTEWGKFNVFRPAARPNVNIVTGLWYSDPRNATINSNGSTTSLKLDNDAMDFKTEIYSQFPGVADYAQMIQGWNQSDIIPRPYGDVKPNSADTQVPYAGSVPIGVNYWAPAPQHRDGPETYGGIMLVEASYTYQVYLRFMPAGNPLNIPVTLARIDWHWNGRASRPDIYLPFTISTNDCPPPSFHDDDTFPLWLHLYSP